MLNWISKILNLVNEFKNFQADNPSGRKDIIHADITPMLKNMVIGNRQKDAIMTKEYSNEFNTVTVEKIVILMEEIAVLKVGVRIITLGIYEQQLVYYEIE